MTPGELLWIVAACAYAVYQQTRRHEVVGASRFKLAIIYAIVGLVVGGFNLPRTELSVVLLIVSLALSLIVGLIRWRLTQVWLEDGRVYSQGTQLTIALFLFLVLSKFVLGFIAYKAHSADDGGVGEVILMIAVMIAVQAELIWRRAKPLGARTSSGQPIGSWAPNYPAPNYPGTNYPAPDYPPPGWDQPGSR